jgi:carboxylesterase
MAEQIQSGKYNFYLKGGSDAVLLIHGITGTPSEMHFIGKSLHKAGFSVLCNALPRHCQSLNELRKVTWQEIAKFCEDDFQRLAREHKRVFVGGLSMGALMAVHLAFLYPERVAGIIALAPTLFYDGWALHKGKVLMHAVWHVPVLRNRINIREGWPYGLKDEVMRGHIERFYKHARANDDSDKALLFGSPFFPLACLYQHQQFVKIVQKEIPQVKNPLLIIHAREDDMTSPKNAQFIHDTIGSSRKSLLILQDSYHMITIDQEKATVAEAIKAFLHEV